MTASVVSGRTQADTFPIASIIGWHSSTIPNGWLPCDGTTRPIADYPALYDILTNNALTFPYGANVGASFRLPSMVGGFTKSPSTTLPPAGANSNVGVGVASTSHTHNYSLNHSVNASGGASAHIDHNITTKGWNFDTGGTHGLNVSIGALSATINAGANGTLNTAFGAHLHANNSGSTTTTDGHNHSHGSSGALIGTALTSGSLHSHGFNVSTPTNYAFTNTPLVADTPCVFIILASNSVLVGGQ